MRPKRPIAVATSSDEFGWEQEMALRIAMGPALAPEGCICSGLIVEHPDCPLHGVLYWTRRIKEMKSNVL